MTKPFSTIIGGAAAALLTCTGSPARAQIGGGFDLTWSTIDCGGLTSGSSGGTFVVAGTSGQPDAGRMSSVNGFLIVGGFWSVISPDACYANCDGSTTPPILNANDFQCFLNKYAAGDSYANCDGSTSTPILTANDFQCFLNKYAAGCS
jgi:hypothetical protein